MAGKRQTKEALFIEAYITNGGNATQAAVKAGYKRGSAAQKAGYRLSSNVQVAERIKQRRNELVAAAMVKSELTVDEVMQSLARDLRFDPAKMLDENGQLLPISDMPEDIRLALRGMDHYAEFQGRGEDREQVGTTTKVKFPEKTAAREQAMKRFGLYEADNRQKQPQTLLVGQLTVTLDFDKVRSRARTLKAA